MRLHNMTVAVIVPTAKIIAVMPTAIIIFVFFSIGKDSLILLPVMMAVSLTIYYIILFRNFP